MHDARVLVVDDSAAMRALFSDLLEQSRNVRVVGTAANVNEAREQIELLRPNVLTLDVEMPGMSGIEFLEEIMDSNPMPVVMLSSLTQSGAVTTLRAYELGAVECFPKPLKVSPEQFAKNVSKLGKIVLAAANSNVRQKRPHHVNRWHKEQFHWNGTLIAINASMGGFEALTDLFAAYPPNCPPTVVVLQAEPEVANAFIQRLNTELACTVTPAKDGTPLLQGGIYIASDPDFHVVLEAGEPAQLRLLAREPANGVRPSADLLFGTIARAGVPAIGIMLSGLGQDGAKGLLLMRNAGAETFAQERGNAIVPEAPTAAINLNAATHELPADQIGAEAIKACTEK